MLAIRFSTVFIFALLASLGLARAEQPPPLQEPQLRIEAGMHTDRIAGLSVSSDSRLMATGSDDKTVRLWSLPEGKLLRVIRVPIGPEERGAIHDVALSPDGTMVAVVGSDAHWSDHKQPIEIFAYLFDTASGALIRRLGPMTGGMERIAFSPDGKRLVVGLSNLNGIRVWTAPFAGEFFSDEHYGGSVRGLAFGPSGSGRLATTSKDGNIRVYNADLNQPLRKAKAPGGKVPHGISFSPDGKIIAVGYYDLPNIDLIDASTLTRVHAVDTSFAKFNSLSNVAWSADGTQLYAGGDFFDDAGFRIVRWPNGGHGGPVPVGLTAAPIRALATLADGGLLFSTDKPSLVHLAKNGTYGFMRDSVTANMAGKVGDFFSSAPDGAAVWFGLKYRGGVPWRFDAAALTFDPTPTRPEGDVIAVTDTLPITNWHNKTNPLLRGKPLLVFGHEVSRSLAIAPDAKSFVLGTQWLIYRFSADGKWLWSNYTESPVFGVNLSADGSIVIAALGNGTIRWYRALDGKELLAFFVHVTDKRWIAWTPSGYYAASPGAEDLIGWHVNGKTWDDTPQFYPASRFRDQFYRPDIVQLVLRTKDEAKAVKEANQLAGRKEEEKTVEELLPASVELLIDAPQIRAVQKEITVKYRLASPTGRAVTRVEARIDGRPVVTRGMEVLTDDFPLGEVLQANIIVPARDSELSIIAYIGDQPGVAATVPIKWTGVNATAPKAKLFALLVGVSAYANPSLKLNYAAKDAADFARALEVQKGRLYESVKIVELLDGNASKSAVETALAKLKKEVGPDDTAVVFLAGHGVTDKRLDFYYLTADADTDPEMLSATAIDGDIIRKTLSQVPGRVVLFMDACRSGAGIAGKVDMNRLSNDFAQDTGGLVMFASSQGREDSLESSAWENGAFTEAMLAILDDGTTYGADKQLSIPELEEALTIRVRELTEDRQSPVMTKYGAIPRFFIAATQ